MSSIIPQVLDGNTQVVVLGTGDAQYEAVSYTHLDVYKRQGWRFRVG